MKWLPVCFVGVALLTACERRPPIYRATVKLLVTRAASAPASVREDDVHFLAAQIDISRSPDSRMVSILEPAIVEK